MPQGKNVSGSEKGNSVDREMVDIGEETGERDDQKSNDSSFQGDIVIACSKYDGCDKEAKTNGTAFVENGSSVSDCSDYSSSASLQGSLEQEGYNYSGCVVTIDVVQCASQ